MLYSRIRFLPLLVFVIIHVSKNWRNSNEKNENFDIWLSILRIYDRKNSYQEFFFCGFLSYFLAQVHAFLRFLTLIITKKNGETSMTKWKIFELWCKSELMLVKAANQRNHLASF